MQKFSKSLTQWIVLCLLGFISFPSFAQSSATGQPSTRTRTFTKTGQTSRVPPTMALRHNLTASTYQQEFDRLKRQGYRIEHISGYEVNGQVRYAAIWHKKSGPELIAHHGLPSSAYQNKVDAYVKQGFHIKQVSGYDVKGEPHFAVIFEKDNGPPQVSRHNMSAAKYQEEYNNWTGKGYRLTGVSGYAHKGKALYAAIWENKKGPSMKTHHGMTSATYQQKFDSYKQQGFQVSYISAYRVGNVDYYAAIWEKGNGKAWAARHRMNSHNYQNNVDNFHYQGYQLQKVSGYNMGGKAHFAAIWEEGLFKQSVISEIDKKVKAVLEENDIPGLQFAISKDEKLVFAKGYGKADKENNIIMSPKTIGRIASVSKPITSVGVLKLALESKNSTVKLGNKVFGDNSIFGTDLGEKEYSENEKKIRVVHLLEHTAGANPWDNNFDLEHLGESGDEKESPKTNDPMFTNTTLDHDGLIGQILDDRNPDYSPGSYAAYSNFGYCILGRIIEKGTGQGYEEWMKNNILKQCDITDMHIAEDDLKDKRWNEMVYYGKNGAKPYDAKVNRMDSHGGWVASSIDLLRFAAHVDGKSGKKDIISPQTFKTMMSQTSYSANPVRKSKTYAKGWGVDDKEYRHGGNLTGTRARLVIYKDGYSYAIIANTDEGSKGFNALVENIIEDILKKNALPNYDLF